MSTAEVLCGASDLLQAEIQDPGICTFCSSKAARKKPLCPETYSPRSVRRHHDKN